MSTEPIFDPISENLSSVLASPKLVRLVRSYYAELDKINQVIVLSVDSVTQNLKIGNMGCIQWLTLSESKQEQADSVLQSMGSQSIANIRQQSRYAKIGDRLLLVIDSKELAPLLHESAFTMTEDEVRSTQFVCESSGIIEPRVVSIRLDSIISPVASRIDE